MNTGTKRSVLITGCSSGIGFYLAKGLMENDFHVIASCRREEDKNKLSSLGIETVLIDLNDSESIKTGLEAALSLTGGQLYGLINNAGYGQPGAVEDLSRDALREQFETNVFGTQELTNHVLPIMRKQNEGRIIQLSSILGVVCLKFRGAYNASKFALEALTDTMRLELADTNIKFCLVEPGPIASHFRENSLKKYRKHIEKSNSPFKHLYHRLEARLEQVQPSQFTLGPEAVLSVVLHGLNSNKPKIRYPVTFPAKTLSRIKRLLSDRMLDKVLLTSSNKE